MSRQWVNSIQWNTPIQSYLIEWCDFMNFINNIITVLYRADSYLVIIHQFTSINWMELNVMILDWLERYKGYEGTEWSYCDMKLNEWVNWLQLMNELSECKQRA